MRYYLITFGRAPIKMTRDNKCWRECEEEGILAHWQRGYKLVAILENGIEGTLRN